MILGTCCTSHKVPLDVNEVAAVHGRHFGIKEAKDYAICLVIISNCKIMYLTRS